MSNAELPERPSLEYLKKLAKERLEELRRSDPLAKLATAQLSIARDYGFPSWRALKAELDRRTAPEAIAFFESCARGDIAGLRALLAQNPHLLHAEKPFAPHGGWRPLHAAARAGQPDIVRFLLERGADPNAREEGDNTYPLHWAAAQRHTDIVRALLDAGGDVDGTGDVHQLDAIGWATFFHPPGGAPGDDPVVAELLVERGARHHIFSAMSLGDLNLIRQVAEDDPNALKRRMSRFEKGLTPLHFAVERKRYDILDLLVEMHADLEDTNANGHTALEVAMLGGDREAMTRLLAAGAKQPVRVDPASIRSRLAGLADSVAGCSPMIFVPDVAAALDWYVSIGFKEVARYGDDGLVNFGIVCLGKAEIMLNMHGKQGDHDVTLWFQTDKVEDLYEVLKARHIEATHRGTESTEGVHFTEHINDTFYGSREFGIRDPNGYGLYFYKQLTS